MKFRSYGISQRERVLSLGRQPNANSLIRDVPDTTEHVLTETRALEALKPEETNLKARNVFVFPLLFTGRISVNIFIAYVFVAFMFCLWQ